MRLKLPLPSATQRISLATLGTFAAPRRERRRDKREGGVREEKRGECEREREREREIVEDADQVAA